MKKFFTIFISLLFIFELGFTQTIKVKREAMSPGRRSSGPPNYTAPTGPYYISTGLRVVPKGMKAYCSADTTGSGTNVVTSFMWTFVEKPAGSTAAFDTATNKFVSFITDLTGRYIVQVAVNGGAATAQDTFYASTYQGAVGTGLKCGLCHATQLNDWKLTKHATIFMRGISGQLEVNSYGFGSYGKSCIKCHTTGWEDVTNNGNFGYLAKSTGWDTTWYKPWGTGSSFSIPNGDSTAVNQLYTSYSSLVPVANIGCENCHGPGNDHNGDKTKIAWSFDAGVCNACHDAPKKHRLGSYWQESAHSNMRLSSSESNRTQCFPCHNGMAFAYYTDNKTSPNYSKVDGNFKSIACATCHDPHSSTNEYQLRTLKLDSLMNGYQIPTYLSGPGGLCMNCHRARTNSQVQVNNQQIRFADRFYPHYSPQADMFVGANGIEYGLNLAGIGTHHGLEKGCVTCHMSTRVNGSSVHPDHAMEMKENGADKVEACKECHGSWITKFDDIKASTDFDGNGKIEGVQTEIQGMLDKLKAILPKGADGEPVNRAADSMLVKNDPNWPKNLSAIFNYYFVKNDWSKGVHNTKYAVALLKASLGSLTGVMPSDQEIPKAFDLSQNYPNPFNPNTEIKFSLPKSEKVRLNIYNIAGELIQTLANGDLAPGNYKVTWDGKDKKGSSVASGVYIYRLESKSFTSTKKMVLMK